MVISCTTYTILMHTLILIPRLICTSDVRPMTSTELHTRIYVSIVFPTTSNTVATHVGLRDISLCTSSSKQLGRQKAVPPSSSKYFQPEPRVGFSEPEDNAAFVARAACALVAAVWHIAPQKSATSVDAWPTANWLSFYYPSWSPCRSAQL